MESFSNQFLIQGLYFQRFDDPRSHTLEECESNQCPFLESYSSQFLESY